MKSYSVAIIAIYFLCLLDSTSSTGNFCGTSWMDAVGKCSRPCPTGAPTQCGGGETCFANTPVSFYMFYYRIAFAMQKCSQDMHTFL